MLNAKKNCISENSSSCSLNGVPQPEAVDTTEVPASLVGELKYASFAAYLKAQRDTRTDSPKRSPYSREYIEQYLAANFGPLAAPVEVDGRSITTLHELLKAKGMSQLGDADSDALLEILRLEKRRRSVKNSSTPARAREVSLDAQSMESTPAQLAQPAENQTRALMLRPALLPVQVPKYPSVSIVPDPAPKEERGTSNNFDSETNARLIAIFDSMTSLVRRADSIAAQERVDFSSSVRNAIQRFLSFFSK